MGVPTVSRASIFDANKRYLGATYQGNAMVFDWDRTETDLELMWFMMQSMNQLLGDSLYADPYTGLRAFSCDGSGSLTNNIKLRAGTAFINGRMIYVENDFYYDESGESTYADPVNYILKGTATAITEIAAGTTYDIQDKSKAFNSDLFLSTNPLRVVITSGTLDGSVFEIAYKDDDEIRVTGDLSTMIISDTYIIYPPALAQPGTEILQLITWLENVDKTEDTDLEDPTFTTQATPNRKQLRWAVVTDSSAVGTESPVDDVSKIDLETITSADTTITDADVVSIINPYRLGRDFFMTLSKMTTVLANVLNTTDVGIGSDFGAVSIAAQTGTTSTVEILDANIQSGRWSTVQPPYSADIVNTTYDATAVTAIAADTMVISAYDDGTNHIEVERTTDGALVMSADRLVLSTSYHDASSQTLRAMSMGDLAVKQGFDYYTAGDGASDAVTIEPGQLQWNGKLYQNPTSKVIHLNTAGAWIAGTPATGWLYIYAVIDPTSVTPGLVTFQADLVKPKWDGSHPTQAVDSFRFCIGVGWFSAVSGFGLRGVCRDNTYYFGETRTLNTFTSNQSMTATWEQPPEGISKMDLQVFVSTPAGTTAPLLTVENYWDYSIDGISFYEDSVIIPVGEDNFTQRLQLPGSIGYVRASVSNFTSGMFQLLVKSLSFSPNYWPDDFWSTPI